MPITTFEGSHRLDFKHDRGQLENLGPFGHCAHPLQLFRLSIFEYISVTKLYILYVLDKFICTVQITLKLKLACLSITSISVTAQSTCGLFLDFIRCVYNLIDCRPFKETDAHGPHFQACNRPLPSSKSPYFQNEARCTTILVKMSF